MAYVGFAKQLLIKIDGHQGFLIRSRQPLRIDQERKGKATEAKNANSRENKVEIGLLKHAENLCLSLESPAQFMFKKFMRFQDAASLGLD